MKLYSGCIVMLLSSNWKDNNRLPMIERFIQSVISTMTDYKIYSFQKLGLWY